MGANRVIVPGFLLLTAVVMAVLAFVTGPPGTVRTALLLAAVLDAGIAVFVLLFGIRSR